MSEKPNEKNPGNPTGLVSYREYSDAMRSLEHRLTKLESRQWINIGLVILTLLTALATAARVFAGG